MYLSASEYLAKLVYSGSNWHRIDQIEELMKKYPSLRVYEDYLGRLRLCTYEVNSLVDEIFLWHRTDSGGSIEVLPFIQEDGVEIHSDPVIFIVGHANDKGFGEVPLHDWKNLLEDEKICKDVVRKIRDYLDKHAPVNYSDVDE
jgi:hypothetical protein